MPAHAGRAYGEGFCVAPEGLEQKPCSQQGLADDSGGEVGRGDLGE